MTRIKKAKAESKPTETYRVRSGERVVKKRAVEKIFERFRRFQRILFITSVGPDEKQFAWR
jgi:hypothetical protein